MLGEARWPVSPTPFEPPETIAALRTPLPEAQVLLCIYREANPATTKQNIF